MGQCSKCGGDNNRGRQWYCHACHAEYMRTYRPKYKEMNPEQQMKDRARAYANTYQKRGLLTPEPCRDCGSEDNLHKHHEDYSKPLEVVWLCAPCHRDRHNPFKQLIRKHLNHIADADKMVAENYQFAGGGKVIGQGIKTPIK